MPSALRRSLLTNCTVLATVFASLEAGTVVQEAVRQAKRLVDAGLLFLPIPLFFPHEEIAFRNFR